MFDRDDSGAVAVEFALIVPVLVLLLFGIIEFSLLMRDHVATTSLVRAGARTASALPRQANFITETVTAMERAGSALPKDAYEELWVYQAQASGVSAGHPIGDTNWTTCNTNCRRYAWNATRDTFAPDGGPGWNYLNINACPGDTNAQSVGVYLRAEHNWITGMFADSTNVADHAVLKFEPIATYSAAVPCKP